MFEIETYTNYTARELDMGRLNELNTLMNLCAHLEIPIKKIYYTMNGFIVTFENSEGDAALHDGTYGHERCYWETYKFPWDEDDVSVHTTEELLLLLNEYYNN